MMKKLSIIALATTVAIAPAYAEVQNTPIASPVANHSETADLAFAFEDVDNLQLTVMSDAQMRDTQGAAIVFAPLVLAATGGGAVGAWGNHYNSYRQTGQIASTSSTLRATGNGALTGASFYGGGRAIASTRHIAFDGPSKGYQLHRNGRIFGVRHGVSPNKKEPIFRLDYHNNPSPTKLHVHIGKGKAGDFHRPWNTPWKKY